MPPWHGELQLSLLCCFSKGGQTVMRAEDRATGRPQWEAAGVEVVRDVRPYQELKLRLLNGAHSAIAYAGGMLGKPFVADVMADPVLARFVERLMLGEIAPLTTAPPGFDVERYVRAILRRFGNRRLQHRTLQIAMDGSQMIPVRWLPVLREARRRDAPVPHLVTALAVWLRFLTGRDEFGRNLPLDDPLAARLRAVAGRTPTTRRPWSGRRWRSRTCSAPTCSGTRPCRSN